MKRYMIAPLLCLLTFSIDGNASNHRPARISQEEESSRLRASAVYKMNVHTQYDDIIASAMTELISTKSVQRLRLRSSDAQLALNILTHGIVHIEEDGIKSGYYMLDDGDRVNQKAHEKFFNKFKDIFVVEASPLHTKSSRKRERSPTYSTKDLSVHPFPMKNSNDKVGLAVWSVDQGIQPDNLTELTLKYIATPSLFNYRDIIANFFDREGSESLVTAYGTHNATVTFDMDEPISNRTATIKLTTIFGTMKPQHLADRNLPWYLSMTSQQGSTQYTFDINLNHPKASTKPTIGFLEMTFNN